MAAKPSPLETGTKAPRFTAKTFSGDKVALKDHEGRKVLVYFYPKDMTPGCTKQACNLRDNLGTLADAGIDVIGISPDDNDRHEKFTDKYDLNFPLVPDPDRKIIEKYGVWGEKKNYGKTFMGLQRTSFLVDEKGVIRHVFKRPKVAEHAEEVLRKIDQLGL